MPVANLSIQGVDVLVDGVGPDTIVMVHGWPDTCRLWDGTVDALKARYRCVRFTLPGFDLAGPARAMSLAQMTELLRAIADAVSPGRPVTLLLHDWGCVFGYEFAARHASCVARIVAVDIGDHNRSAYRRSLSAKAKWQVFAYQFWLALAWKFGGALGDRMTRQMARAMRCRADPALIGWQMNYPDAMQWFGSAGGFRGAQPVDPHCPVLYLYGTRKPFMFQSQEWLDQLAARPGSAARAFHCGHWVMVNQPAEFYQCIDNWLAAQPVALQAPCLPALQP